MNEHLIIQVTDSVVSEPDYVGSNGTQISPIKMFFAVLIVSIAICGVAMNLLASTLTPLTHMFWLVFHILYIGGVVYYFVQKWRCYSHDLEVQ